LFKLTTGLHLASDEMSATDKGSD